MKFSNLLSIALLFVAGAAAKPTGHQEQQQGFNMTALNGTWSLQGLPKILTSQIKLMSQMYNISVSCPQVYITGNFTGNSSTAYNTSAKATYFQPSVDFNWYNSTTDETMSANLTLSGLLTLEEGSNATDANFTAQFSLPEGDDDTEETQSAAYVKMFNAAFTDGNSTDPLPHGTDFWANVTVKLVSSHNDTSYDVFLLNAFNFSSSIDDDNSTSAFQRRDSADDDDEDDDDSVQFFFSNGTTVIDNSTFNTIITEVGQWASNLTYLNNTCSVNSTEGSSA